MLVAFTNRLLWRPAEVVYYCFLEARPAVQGIFLLRFAAGASLVGTIFSGGASFSLWAGAALWACVMSSVYILNGVMDIREDRINGSERPVACGRLSFDQGASAAILLATLGFVGSFFVVGLPMAWSVAAVLTLGYVYSGPPLHLKRWPAGLAAVAILGGLLTYYAGYLTSGGHLTSGDGGNALNLCVFTGVMSLWMGLVGQTKDLSDTEGDKRAGRRSGPVAWGENQARLVYSCVALCLGAAYLLYAAFMATDLLVSAGVLLVGALAVAGVSLSPWSRGERTARRRPYRAFMLTQYGVHLAVIVC